MSFLVIFRIPIPPILPLLSKHPHFQVTTFHCNSWKSLGRNHFFVNVFGNSDTEESIKKKYPKRDTENSYTEEIIEFTVTGYRITDTSLNKQSRPLTSTQRQRSYHGISRIKKSYCSPKTNSHRIVSSRFRWPSKVSQSRGQETFKWSIGPT